MPFYPTFAFFNKSSQLKEIAKYIIIGLGEKVSEISFETNISKENNMSVHQNAVAALQFLKREITFNRFWIASDLHSIELEMSPLGYLCIELWDFEPEVYEAGRLTQDMKLEKRQLAVLTHVTLIKHCGACFSYTSSADDNYSGSEGHYDISDKVYNAIRKNELLTISNILNKPLYFYLVGLGKLKSNNDIIGKKLSENYNKIVSEFDLSILEHKENKPYFLL